MHATPVIETASCVALLHRQASCNCQVSCCGLTNLLPLMYCSRACSALGLPSFKLPHCHLDSPAAATRSATSFRTCMAQQSCMQVYHTHNERSLVLGCSSNHSTMQHAVLTENPAETGLCCRQPMQRGARDGGCRPAGDDAPLSASMVAEFNRGMSAKLQTLTRSLQQLKDSNR